MAYMDWQDLKKYWRIEILGGEDEPFSLRRLYRRVRQKEQDHFLFWLRLAQHLHRRPKGLLNYRKIAKNIRSNLLRTHGIDIMLDAEIGPGIRFFHRVGIVIAGAARIGSNLSIRQNTTIGIREIGQNGLIHIGDHVDIGANVCIIGDDLRIGDNVTIGAMAFINKDIPDNSTCYTQHVATVREKHTTSPLAVCEH